MKRFLTLFISFFVSISVFAATDISHLRNDLTIPEHCQTNNISDFFSDDLKYITFSRTGGVRSGFDYEYDISRESLRKFWSLFKGSPGRTLPDWIKNSEKLTHDYNIIFENYKDMDFDFSEEGQVLEILALLKLKEELDLTKYYITGSVAYSGGKGSNRIGELDIVIGDVETCKVSIVGEVKINPRRLGKAKGQLSRFRRFIKSVK